MGHQLRQLEAGCNILVGTPGRLIDFLGRKKVSGSEWGERLGWLVEKELFVPRLKQVLKSVFS